MQNAPPTAADLRLRGLRVSPDELWAMTWEALSTLSQTLQPADPRTDLTASEAAALERGGFELGVADLGTGDPLARTVAEHAALLETSFTTAAAAERIGVDPSRLRQRLSCQPQTLFGVKVDAGWVIPAFQFDGARLLPGLARVVAELDPTLHPVAVQRWFLTPNPDLTIGDEEAEHLSPRDWLRGGFPPDAVAALARNL